MLLALSIVAGSVSAGVTSYAAENENLMDFFEEDAPGEDASEEDVEDKESSDDVASAENSSEEYDVDDIASEESSEETAEEPSDEVSEEATEDSSEEQIIIEEASEELLIEEASAVASEGISEGNSEELSDDQILDVEDALLNVNGSTNYYYLTEVDGAMQGAPVYFKYKNAKKPSAGSFYYSDADCTKKLTSTWLYTTKTCDESYKYFYVNKKGNFAKGITKVDGTTYYFDKETGRLTKTTGAQKVGSNYYYFLNGVMVTEKGFVYKNNYRYIYYVTGSSGVLATGYRTIKTERYPEGKKYHFEKDATMSVISFSVNGKTYITNQYNYDDPSNPGPEDLFVLSAADVKRLQKVSNGGIDPKIRVNDDGSLYNGWIAIDGIKYYYFEGEPLNPRNALMMYSGATIYYIFKQDTFVANIGGKNYWFNQDGTLNSGWMRYTFDTGILLIKGNQASCTSAKDCYMYFSPSDKAAVKGFKKVFVPKLNARGEFDLDKEGKVVLTDEENTLLFADGKFGGLEPGTLVRDCKYMYKGKLYTLDSVGAVYKITPGPVEQDGGIVYKKADGSLGTGRIDGFYYDPATSFRLSDVVRKSGKKWYYYGKDAQQATSLKVKLDNGKTAEAVFNKDGSIKYFADAAGEKVTDATFTLGSALYFIGNKSLPATGLVTHTFAGTEKAITVVVDNDGRCTYNQAQTASNDYMLKIGKKIYVVSGGRIADDTEKAYKVSDFSKLSSADKKVMEKYQSFACSMATSSTAIDYKNYKLPVYVDSDGHVCAKTIVKDGKTLHINKYGVAFEDLGYFRKQGGSWYFLGAEQAGSAYIDGTLADLKTFNSQSINVNLTWDDKMKMGKFVDASTGKAVSGMLSIDSITINGKTVEAEMDIYVKNGVMSTASKTVSYNGNKITLYFDKDTGLLDYIPILNMME